MYELVIAFLLAVIAVLGAMLLRQKRTSGKTAPDAGEAVPAARDSLQQELVSRMEEFLDRDLFWLVVQPIVDFRDETVFNGEALARLRHPERGIVFPDAFLPVIDELGMYPRFDRYIFRKCCSWLSRSTAEGKRFDCLTCNFSRKTLSEENLARDLIRCAEQYGVPCHKLGIEITEREQETDQQIMEENLKQLRAAGVRIILDDYGSGVTTEWDLLRYPLDIVKIDRSMLLNSCTGRGNEEFRRLVEKAKSRGTEVVCEGIETGEQNLFARETGCDYGQGFLFFKPIDNNQLTELIRKGSILDYVE